MKYANKFSPWIVLMIMVSLTACDSNILDTTPKDQIAPEVFYQNENEAVMGLMGVYNAFNYVWYQHDFMSDNNFMHHDWQGSMEFGNWTHNPESWRAIHKWEVNYATIGRANAFLENIGDAPIGDALINELSAEARFMRAVAYSDLIHYYGDVPLVLSIQSVEEAMVPRDDKDLVLDQILDDFDFAAANLPPTQPSSEVGRATAGAALAMKSRILLYEEHWNEAADAALEVMNLGVYDLFADYETLFAEENQNNVEIIFDVQYMRDQRPQPWPSTCLGYSEWPTPGVTTDIVDEYRMTSGLPIDEDPDYDEQDPFTNRDPRLKATFVLPGTPYGNITFIPANDESPTGMRPRKYAGIELDNKDNCAINWIHMRYADVLLMRAEGLIESGETGQEVYDLINMVRDRVDMPSVEDVDGTGLSQAELRDLLRHERRVEFAMEGTRYSDMRRWELEEQVKAIYGWNRSLLADPNDPDQWTFERQLLENRQFNPQKGWLWPIPQAEMQNNENLEQNPGY